MSTTDALDRYVTAQEGDGTYSGYDTALAELKDENKSTHWIWYVLPQIDGLGSSDMCRRYGVRGLQEAKDYLAHPVLGPRLKETVQVLLDAKAPHASDIVGDGDALKLQSCLTLFHRADPAEPLFTDLLDKYYGGEQDPRTLALL